MKKDVSVSVEGAAYDLAQGVRQFVGHVKAALADGFQVGADVPPILMAAYSDLLSKAADVAQLPAELKEDKIGFARGFAEAGFDLAEDLSA